MELLKNLEGMTPDEQMAAVLELQKAAMANLEEQRQVSIGKSAELVIQGLKKIKSDFEVKFDSLNYDIQSKVASLKDGNPGRDGATGKDGRDGLPGRDGQNGQNGKDGQDGQDGADGVSVTDAKIDFDGSLVITLSSGREINVGEVVAPDLAEKIKVITNGGGTSQGVLDAIAALQTQIDNLIPSQTGNAGKFLTTNGTSTSWAAVASGGLSYQGTWDASTNTPTLASGVGAGGSYYIVATAGSTNLDGITDWQIGDWLLFNGTVWQKIDQSDLVTSVNGQTGAVSLSTTNISEGTNQYFTDARARSAISAGTGISYNSSTGVVTNAAPDQTVVLTGSGTTTVTGTYPNFTIASADSTNGTVTSVGGAGTVNGISLSGAVTSSGNLTLGGALSGVSLATQVSGTLPIANGGTGETTRQAAIDALAGAVTSGQYLRGNGTDVVMSAIQAADVPTLNQNTTGTAENVTGIVAVANGGTGTATPSLVAGTNITISGTFPNQTINGAGSSLAVQDEGSTLTSAATSLNFTGAGVTATNTGGSVTVAITGGGGGISSADIQEFTSTGTSTWTKPAGAKLVYVLMFGGGGGGGSGRRRATLSVATAAFGGGGGGGSGRTELWIPAVDLGSTETVTVGAGGTGGTARPTDDSSGFSGSSGGESLFGSWAYVRGGGNGLGGSTTAASSGSGGGGLAESASGSLSYSASGGGGTSAIGSTATRGGYRPGGGGGGGGFAAGITTGRSGGIGGKGGSLFENTTSSLGGGASGGAAENSGNNGSNSATYFVGGDGGGGGGSGATTAGAGGNGGYPGGGGGGGGAGDGVNSGAGGIGGDGYVRVVTFF